MGVTFLQFALGVSRRAEIARPLFKQKEGRPLLFVIPECTYQEFRIITTETTQQKAKTTA